MKASRRTLLALGALSAASPRVTAAGRWDAFRNEFALTRERVHLAGLLFSSYPKVVRQSIERYRRLLDEDPVEALEHDLTTSEYTNATLDAAARYLGGQRDEIALTDSTTSGLALVFGGLWLSPKDEVVTTKHDHWVTHESLRLLSERSGAPVRTVTLYDEPAEANAPAMAAALAKSLTPATRVVAVTWVHSSTGVKTPIRQFADAVAAANKGRPPAERILLVVDGVHGFGVENATVADLGCDIFVAGCHKWLFGPHGTGIVWARPEAWARLRRVAMPFHFPTILAREYGVGAVPKADGYTHTPGGFRAYEHRWALKEAFDLHLKLGKAEVEARIHELATHCKTGLSGISRVTLHTPKDRLSSSGVVCFEVEGSKPDEVVARLKAQKIVISSTPYIPSYARMTPGLTNTPQEIDRAVAAVAKL